MRKAIRIGAILSLLTASFTLSMAHATSTTLADNSNSTNKINITRTIHGVKSRVSNTFHYSLTQAVGNPATVEGMPSEFDLEVTGNPDLNSDVSAHGGPSLKDYQFTALGDYKFIVRETGSQDAANYPVDSEKEYYYYVSVRNRLNNDGKPTGEYIATMSEQVKNHDTGDKLDAVFESTAIRSKITVTNTVTGNLANVDDYFKYKVVIDGANQGTSFSVYGQDSVVDYGGSTLATKNTVTAGGTNNYIYLKHGQTVYIGYDGEKEELPIGVTYSLIEVDDNGYVQYVDNVAGNTSETKTISADPNASSNKVDFLNHKEGDVLTGIMINVLPYVLAIGSIGLAFAISYRLRRKQSRGKC